MGNFSVPHKSHHLRIYSPPVSLLEKSNALNDATPNPKPASPPLTLYARRRRDLLHYLAYFSAVGALAFIAQTGEPKQAENAVLAGAIACGAVVSRDWYKARLDPNMVEDPTAVISLFSEMLHAGRAQTQHQRRSPQAGGILANRFNRSDA